MNKTKKYKRAWTHQAKTGVSLEQASTEAKNIITTQISNKEAFVAQIKYFPETDPAQLVVIAEDLLRWASQTQSLQIEDFALTRGYNPTRLWVCSDPFFRDCYQYAKHMLGSRMQKEEESNDGRIKWPRLNRMLRVYNTEFKADDTQKDQDQKPVFFKPTRVECSLGMVEVDDAATK